MKFIEADSVSLGIFVAFSIFMFFGISRIFLKNGARSTFVIFLFLVISGTLFSHFGIFSRNPVPMVPIYFLFLVGSALLIAISQSGKKLSDELSFGMLVGFQAFRLPLEILLHHWASNEVIPSAMTWTGQNYDIVTGVLAILLFRFSDRSMKIVWLFQLIGFGLLLNVLRVVVLSMPFPFSWHLENPLQLAFHFPYILIAPLFVWPALVGHLLLWRKLLKTASH